MGKFRPENYRVTVFERAFGADNYIIGLNMDFEIETHERLPKVCDEAERLLFTAKVIRNVQKRIAEEIKRAERQSKQIPPPATAFETIKQISRDDIGLKEVCRLTGHPAWTARRLMDEGAFGDIQRSDRGKHRRCSRRGVEAYLLRKNAAKSTLENSTLPGLQEVPEPPEQEDRSRLSAWT
jgi:hypothetical protein